MGKLCSVLYSVNKLVWGWKTVPAVYWMEKDRCSIKSSFMIFMLFVDVLDTEFHSRMLTSNDIGGIFQFIENKIGSNSNTVRIK